MTYRYLRLVKHPIPRSSDGITYKVLLYTADETDVDSAVPRTLGMVSSYRGTVQRMLTAEGFRGIAAKTSHPKRWRCDPANARALARDGFDTRKGALTILLRNVVPDIEGSERDRIVREASVTRAKK